MSKGNSTDWSFTVLVVKLQKSPNRLVSHFHSVVAPESLGEHTLVTVDLGLHWRLTTMQKR